MSVVIGVAVVGAIFYGVVNSHFLGLIISRTVGPYSDTLAEHGFASSDPEIWQKIAERHRVAIVVRRPGAEPVAYDDAGRKATALPEQPSKFSHGPIRAVRTDEDGTQVTFFFSLWSFGEGHLPLLGGLVFMVVAVVGSAFWFLQRQLKPLAWLHDGVEAVARGDFDVRVPVVRNDEIGQVAEAFNVMTTRVGEMIDDRERLLADVSHELRSPIARMKVALELMPESDKREALARDLREMEALIAVLLEREALRSRADRLEGEEADLRTIAGEVVAAFEDQRPGVELLSGDRVIVRVDPSLIKLLIQNLVHNAVKFSREDSAPVRLSVEVADGYAELCVADDGIGIPAGSEEKVFEPFVKMDPARGHREGYGIGLDLCQRIVQLHGGTIELRARRPRGTEAVVTLPRRTVGGGNG